MTAINTAIETGDSALLMKTLQHPKSQLPEVYDFAGSLYMEEFKNMKEEKEVIWKKLCLKEEKYRYVWQPFYKGK